MQMDIVVETQEEYNKWIAEQQTWMQKQATAAPAITDETGTKTDSSSVTPVVNDVTAQVAMPSSSH